MRGNKESRDIVPIFGEPLEELLSEGSISKIQQLASRPDLIIRSKSLLRKDFDQETKEIVKTESNFRELQKRYSIAIPQFQSLFGEDEYGKMKIYTIVERISGRNLRNTASLPIEAKGKVDVFLTKVLQSVLDAYQARQPYYMDVGPQQWVYGHKHHESSKQDQVYIVDIGEGFIYPDDDEEEYDEEFPKVISDMEKYITECEKKFPPKTILQGAREKLEEILDKFGM